MKWIDPRFAGYSKQTGARLPPHKVEPVEIAIHHGPIPRNGHRLGKKRHPIAVPIYGLKPVRTGKLYSYVGKR